MTGALSKRQQARNEAILQELVHSVPGNDQCADCRARNPSWASWSLGIFLCMRCATIHRKLGTHISKVKSLSMDSWTNEQVDMKKVGNNASNKVYNPENKEPSIPIDVDEADSAMERFIRQKYVTNAGQGGRLKKPQLEEGIPPPLPPKNSKFGFRSASSIFPLSSRAKKEAKAAAAQELAKSNSGSGNSSNHANKQSKVFGAAVDYGQGDTDKKLARLRDMGFQDDHRNATILRGVNGNLERAVEALVRLGEGDGQSPGPVPAAAERTLRTSRSLTPVGSNPAGLNLGLSVQHKDVTSERPTTATAASTNPFDIFPPAQPQTAHSTGTLQTNNPFITSTNPYGAPAPQANLTQAFQNMSLSPAAQSLFPHHTGGVISPPQHHQYTLYQPQQAAQPIPQQYQSPGFQSSMTYPQPAAQPLAPQQTGYNPFFTQTQPTFQQQQPQQAPQQSLSLNTNQAAAYGNNPFTRSPTRISSPSLTQIPEQSLPTMFQSPMPLQPHLTGTNPFLNNGVQYQQQQYQQQQQQQQQLQQQQQPQFFGQQQQQPQFFGQQQQYYQPQRQDKASILALYGQQQAARPSASEPNMHAQPPAIPEDRVMPAQPMPPMPMQPAAAPTQSPLVSSQPTAGNNNPFMKSGPAAAAPDPFATDRKISRESMNLGMDLAWTNGRHSPDAFASLSARYG
ncbi:hypothetical protein TGAM01_v202789 [Trichoderma gamsii]|uniref:Arf-GAP domain-containing protein n=1 Tax=Trichoderma gamsii TaxID=398673 RepID=A0A2P4ZVJ6_9HYPO|nr:hypothetical protein TGAM01_v202789 [Trichoderma gamsii]PON28295.1 hypothetical protein TGAM01_v202789 [Trichoderma gamsii]